MSLTFGPGTLLVISDNGAIQQGVIDMATHASEAIGPAILGETSAQLTSGLFAVLQTGNIIRFFGPNLTETANNTNIFGHFGNQFSPCCAVPAKGTFWACTSNTGIGNALLRQVLTDGTATGTVFTLGSTRALGLAVDADEHIAYYTDGNNLLKRWDLQTNMAMADLVTGGGSDQVGLDLFYVTVAPHNLVLPWSTNGGSDPWFLRVYNTSGVLQRAISLPSDSALASDIRIAQDIGTPDLVWAMTFPDATEHTSRFLSYKMSTGALQDDFTIDTAKGSGVIPFSCPFLAWSISNSGGNISNFVGTLQTRKMLRLRRVPAQVSDNDAVQFWGRVLLEIQSGLGIAGSPAVNAICTLKLSWDNGYTWGPEIEFSLGKEGELYQRLFMDGMWGSGRWPVIEWRCTDNVNATPTELFVTFEEGTS